jgi:hypothetical protein
VVERAFALDARRHLALLNRYPGFLARPDRWVAWRIGALPTGLRLIRRHRPQIIWSTYPIATAHVIGADLHRASGLPWVADFRDPMAQEGYPADPKTWQSFYAIEQKALRQAACSVFTAPGAAQMYRDRYPDLSPGRIRVIENGYDEESFASTKTEAIASAPLIPGKLTLLHSGVIYPSERDPTQLFAALARLAAKGRIGADRFVLRLRAPSHESLLAALVDQFALRELVELAPPIPYRQAIEEMVRADGLLILQAANCNQQIPAKLYEYLRARRPILGLTDPAGDTAGVLRQAGIDGLAPLDSAEAIAEALTSFLDKVRTRSARLPDTDYVASASRLRRTEELASLLDQVAQADKPRPPDPT